MRVLHVTNLLEANGTGITNIVIDLACAEADSGHEVAVMCGRADQSTRELLQLHRVAVLDGFDTTAVVSSVRAFLRGFRQLRQWDVVHVHTVRAALLTLAINPKILRKRTVSTIHNPYQASVVLMYLVRCVVSISQQDAAYIRRRTWGLCRPRVVLNGLLGSPRLSTADFVTAITLPGRPIVFVGALYSRKGVDTLLRAMPSVLAAVPDARLYLVGNRDNPELEDLARALGLSDVVQFVGFVSDPRIYMKAADVFVLPSRAEGFGNVLTEARSVGAPIIASRVGGIPEALDDGAAGILIAASDKAELSASIIRVLTSDELSRELRDRSLRNLARFTLRSAATKYLAIYEDIVLKEGEASVALVGLPRVPPRA